MPVSESGELWSALCVIREDILDAMRLTHASLPGDRVPLGTLENMFLRASALLHQLEQGDWTGRTVKKQDHLVSVDSTTDSWDSPRSGRTYKVNPKLRLEVQPSSAARLVP